MTAATAAAATQAPPDSALIRQLGHAGLLPFVLLALLLWLLSGQEQVFVSVALTSYAALVVSFLGGVHWGIVWMASRLATDENRNLIARQHLLWGITPPLLAWPGVLMPPFAGLAWLGFVLVLAYLADRALYPRAGLQVWLTLRFRLSAIAALSCFIGAGAV